MIALAWPLVACVGICVAGIVVLVVSSQRADMGERLGAMESRIERQENSTLTGSGILEQMVARVVKLEARQQAVAPSQTKEQPHGLPGLGGFGR